MKNNSDKKKYLFQIILNTICYNKMHNFGTRGNFVYRHAIPHQRTLKIIRVIDKSTDYTQRIINQGIFIFLFMAFARLVLSQCEELLTT